MVRAATATAKGSRGRTGSEVEHSRRIRIIGRRLVSEVRRRALLLL